ncbi:MAG: efflux RND transporter periplasmic adaptor subunit [Betaproteobacteria bacterium]|nr:MAG: efflux RND transporter periplasmic adaptor subunit [Betaproteobacteria bacterium]
MKPTVLFAAAVVLGGALLAAGYWWGVNQPASFASRAAEGKAGAKSERKVLYYRNPMAPTDTSPAPKKAPDGMDFVPVYADDAAGAPTDKAKAKILFYRNPMGLPDTSPVPKKDSMGMDYIAVYEDDEPASATPLVKLSLDKVQKLGVKTEAVAMRDLNSTIRAVATVQANERLLHTVTTKFDGWIERLHVNTTGQAVRKGEALMDVYSPELITAQQEYLIAKRGVQMLAGGSAETQAGMQRLADSALQRLRNWDISATELQRLTQEGKTTRYLTLRSPANGVVLEKPAIQGKRFMAGEVLYQVADLSQVWLLADVFEQDLGQVRIGQSANIKVDAYPDKALAGKVTFIYPTVTAETRTAKVRVELANPQALLKPSMYARVEFISSRGKGQALSVPDSAVLDTGTRQLVLVRRAEGRFEPRPVKLGMRVDGYIEVLEGVKAGENVVVSANFLIDAESNLKAAFSGFGQNAEGAKPVEKGEAKPTAATAGTAPATHRGTGTVEAVDPAQASVTLAHGPIPSLKWPAMTMDFKVKDAALLRTLKPGQKIDFDTVAGAPGEYLIVRAQQSIAPKPTTESKPAAGPKPAAAAHKGH